MPSLCQLHETVEELIQAWNSDGHLKIRFICIVFLIQFMVLSTEVDADIRDRSS